MTSLRRLSIVLLLAFALIGARSVFAADEPSPAPGRPAGGAPAGARGERISAEVIAGALADIAPEKGPYVATWESVSQHTAPDWYRDAKFGIGMHWGPYAVPAHGSEWYVKHMYGNPQFTQWHAEHFGPLDKFGYKDFIPLFTAAKFNADEWADLFAKAGARYVMPTAGSTKL